MAGIVTPPEAGEGGLLPTALVATTLKMYVWPLVNPPAGPNTVHAIEVVVVQVWVPGVDVTVYEMTGDPPSLLGAVHDTSTLVPATTADRTVGAPGTFGIDTLADCSERELLPNALVAITVKVNDAPRVNPRTVHAVPVEVVQLAVPGDATAVYDVIGVPPSLAGATQATSTLFVTPTPTADTFVGTPGLVGTNTPADAEDGALAPTPFVATTVKVYVTPGVSAENVHPVPVGPVVHVRFCGDDVAVYDVIAEPPSLTEATHKTSTLVVVPTAAADTPVGATGTAGRNTAADGAEGGPSPTALVATTVNV